MRVVLQRVKNASVTIDHKIKSQINEGMMVLLGIEDSDNEDDIDWICNKIVNLRIFDDASHVMNLSIKDTDGDILVVSQFTLMASTKKGNRPSYIRASKPDIARPIYQKFCLHLSKIANKDIQTGTFGADMDVALINDGPVTIIIDSNLKE